MRLVLAIFINEFIKNLQKFEEKGKDKNIFKD
jgi:hypothetical protein